MANSARIITNECKCSATTVKCTEDSICNTGGTCEGKYKQSYQYYPYAKIHSKIILVMNPIYFHFIHEQILLITLQQQSNPGKITNLAPGKLLLNESM